MATIEVRGTELNLVERGTGEPALLIHGSASDFRTWQSQLDSLSSTCRVIAYSRRYHWPNEGIPDGGVYTMTEHVDDLESLLRSLEVAPAHLVGHSYGAFLALLVSMRAPQLVRSVVLAEPPVITLFVSQPPRLPEILRLMLSRPRTALALVAFGATGIGPATKAAKRGDMDAAMRIFGKAVLGSRFFAELSPERLDQVRANAFRSEFLGPGFPRLDPEEVRRVEIPALLIRGEKSPAVFHRLLDGLGELLPRTDLVEIPGASHMMHEDDPSAFNAALLRFWKRLRAA